MKCFDSTSPHTSLRLASVLALGLSAAVSGCALFLGSSPSSSPVCLFAPDDTAASACFASRREVSDAIEHYYAIESIFAGKYEMSIMRMRADAQTNGRWAVHVDYEYRALPTWTNADGHGVDRRIFTSSVVASNWSSPTWMGPPC